MDTCTYTGYDVLEVSGGHKRTAVSNQTISSLVWLLVSMMCLSPSGKGLEEVRLVYTYIYMEKKTLPIIALSTNRDWDYLQIPPILYTTGDDRSAF